ncbi:MAG TPA: hypothetical protein VG294_04240 [Solirubrobacteraceae bacterium]|jgi:hypothetical protein|nr:hypothetical protein [Solirubrobacteraceae bacterium]
MKLTSAVRAIAISGAAAAALAGCGSSFTAVPGSSVPAATKKPIGYGVVDQAPLPHTKCIRAAGLPAVRVGPASIQVGTLPSGPTIRFAPDPNAAEAEQIEGLAQGAEVIGAAVLYVNGASGAELKIVEACLTQGVAG